MWQCTKGEFASLIGKSRSYVDLLSKIGVIDCDYLGRVIIMASLRRYFLDYLWHLGSDGRQMEIERLIKRISEMKIKRSQKTGLHHARAFLPSLRKAELKLTVLKNLKKLGLGSPINIQKAENELLALRAAFERAKKNLREKILSKKIKPVQIETILLARYVDCEKWEEIASDYNYCLSHVYRLHRKGLNLLQPDVEV